MSTIAILLAGPFSIAWKGYVLAVLWGWFVAPLGAPALTVPLACGLALLVSFLTAETAFKKETKPTGELLAVMAVSPALALLIGWIIKQFM